MLRLLLLLIMFSFISGALVSVRAESTSNTKKPYDYPYLDPYLATTTVAIMKGREHIVDGQIHDLRLNIMPDRNDVYLLEGKGDLRYRFYQLNHPAPLVFLIPGFAGSAYSGSACFVAEWLADNGFQVIVLPSPFHWNFVLAASTHGVPGLRRQDTQDLYRAMQLTLGQVKSEFDVHIEGIGMLGLSEGAVNVADVSLLEQSERRIGIDRYLLINPPVDLLATAKRIDQMAALGDTYTPEQRKYLEGYAFGVATDAMDHNIDANYFAQWDQRLRISPRQARYLVGRTLQLSLGDSVYVVELVDQAGVLKSPVSREDRAARMAEAHSYGLMDYFHNFLIPIGDRFQPGNKPLTLDNLNQRASLPRIGHQLIKRKDVFLMHNQDDVLLAPDDLHYLRSIFGARATIYPHGGHLGNLWCSRNKQDMLQIFQSLHMPSSHS